MNTPNPLISLTAPGNPIAQSPASTKNLPEAQDNSDPFDSASSFAAYLNVATSDPANLHEENTTQNLENSELAHFQSSSTVHFAFEPIDSLDEIDLTGASSLSTPQQLNSLTTRVYATTAANTLETEDQTRFDTSTEVASTETRNEFSNQRPLVRSQSDSEFNHRPSNETKSGDPSSVTNPPDTTRQNVATANLDSQNLNNGPTGPATTKLVSNNAGLKDLQPESAQTDRSANNRVDISTSGTTHPNANIEPTPVIAIVAGEPTAGQPTPQTALLPNSTDTGNLGTDNRNVSAYQTVIGAGDTLQQQTGRADVEDRAVSAAVTPTNNVRGPRRELSIDSNPINRLDRSVSVDSTQATAVSQNQQGRSNETVRPTTTTAYTNDLTVAPQANAIQTEIQLPSGDLSGNQTGDLNSDQSERQQQNDKQTSSKEGSNSEFDAFGESTRNTLASSISSTTASGTDTTQTPSMAVPSANDYATATGSAFGNEMATVQDAYLNPASSGSEIQIATGTLQNAAATQTTASDSLPIVDSTQIVQQVVNASGISEAIASANVREANRIRINLHPQELGALTIEIQRINDIANINIVAENQGTQLILERNIDILMNSFESRETLSVNVNVSHGSPDNPDGTTQQQHADRQADSQAQKRSWRDNAQSVDTEPNQDQTNTSRVNMVI